jgi:hypothetical protein
VSRVSHPQTRGQTSARRRNNSARPRPCQFYRYFPAVMNWLKVSHQTITVV